MPARPEASEEESCEEGDREERMDMNLMQGDGDAAHEGRHDMSAECPAQEQCQPDHVERQVARIGEVCGGHHEHLRGQAQKKGREKGCVPLLGPEPPGDGGGGEDRDGGEQRVEDRLEARAFEKGSQQRVSGPVVRHPKRTFGIVVDQRGLHVGRQSGVICRKVGRNLAVQEDASLESG